MTSYKKRCVILLGMHRSGTSAISGALSAFGIDFGANLYEADSNNLRGYFENRGITSLQNSLLLKAGYSWSDPITLDSAESDLCSPQYIEQLKNIFSREFDKQELFGFKDPRTSCFLASWIKIFESLYVEPHFVLCFRSPYSVISSLVRRDGIEPSHAELLWLLEYMRTLPKISKYKHVLINYDEFVINPVASVKNINSNLGLNIQYDDAAILKVDKFVDKNLNHGERIYPLRDCTEKVWAFLKDKSDTATAITENDCHEISLFSSDIGGYRDWALMKRFPESIRRWDAYLFYQGVYSNEFGTQYVCSKVFSTPHKWITVRFLLDDSKIKQLALSLLEYTGEYSISALYLYDDVDANHCLASYSGDALNGLMDVWEGGYCYRERDYMHIIQYGSLCNVNFNLSKDLFNNTKILDVCLRVESLKLSDKLKRIFKFFKPFENICNLGYWKWKINLQVFKILRIFNI